MAYDRKHNRHHLVYYLRIFENNTGKLIGHLVNITAKGIMVLSDEPIELNASFQLKMLLPGKASEKQSMVFNAKSLWCERDVNADFFDTGFQLIDVSQSNVEAIKALIEDFGMNN